MPDGMHKSAEGYETNPTYIAAKKAKHLEDSETTPKSCLVVVFKLLETSSQTSSQNSLSKSVQLLQSQVLAEMHSATQLRLEVLSLRKIAENTNENFIAKQLQLEAMTDMLGQSHSLAQQLAEQLPRKANLS
jgi:hypothetical protein